MDTKVFVRRPFLVDAIEITRENIEELAPKIGDLEYKDDGTPYILVDRRRVPNVYRVFPGFWMTKMGEKYRCYSRRIFREQFIASNPEVMAWVDYLADQKPVTFTVDAPGQAVEPAVEVEDVRVGAFGRIEKD